MPGDSYVDIRDGGGRLRLWATATPAPAMSEPARRRSASSASRVGRWYASRALLTWVEDDPLRLAGRRGRPSKPAQIPGGNRTALLIAYFLRRGRHRGRHHRAQPAIQGYGVTSSGKEPPGSTMILFTTITMSPASPSPLGLPYPCSSIVSMARWREFQSGTTATVRRWHFVHDGWRAGVLAARSAPPAHLLAPLARRAVGSDW